LNSYLILPLIQSGFSLILIPIVLRGHQQKATHRLFAVYLLGLATWGLLIFLMRSSPNLQRAYYWENWLIGLIPLMSVIFYHFSIRHTRIRINKKILPLAYAISIILIVVARTTDLIIQGMQLKPYGYAPIAGPLLPPLILFGYVFTLMALFNFLKANKITPYAEVKNQNNYIVTGLIFSLIGGAFDLLPILGLPLYPGVIIGNIIFCLITTMAIVKHHLLDIHLVFRKGLAYVLMSTIVAIPYVGIIILFNTIFGKVAPAWAFFLLILLLAIALQPLWNIVQRLVDRWFYRERFDYLKALNIFAEKTHDISDLNQFSDSLVKLASKALQASNIYLLLRSEYEYSQVSSLMSGNTNQLKLKNHSPLIRWLQDNKGLLSIQDMDIIPQMQALTTKEITELRERGIVLVVPLKTRKKELIGLLLLGQKLSERLYSEEDKQIISTVADRVAIELENARLYSLEKDVRCELEKEIEQKTGFLHNVAHELKTPLTAIISSAEILESELPSNTYNHRQKLIQNIKYSAWLMDKRVAELLNLARIQIGSLGINPEYLEVNIIVKDTISQLLPLFKNKEQSLKLEIQNSLPKIKADRGQLEQILFNILSNANKFSPTGGNIIVRTKQVDDSLVVEVQDSAPAITEKDSEKLFTPYYRGEDVNKRQRISGLGLGLAISKKLVELHQGKIWYESKPNSGNTFAFSLPINNKEKEQTGQLSYPSGTTGGKIESTNH